MLRKSKFVIGLLLAIALISCGGYRLYVNEEADFGFYKRIGVLPFSNLSGDRNASDKVTSSFLTELLIGSHVEIVPMGDMLKSYRNVIKDERTNLPEQLTAEEAQAIGKDANIQGVLVGVVRDYSQVRSGQEDFPLVSIAVRLIDCQSGKVVWTYERTERGGPKFPIFSFGETHTLADMTSKVCRKIAAAFTETLK
jgi:polysaccharide biosynthesis protein PelC